VLYLRLAAIALGLFGSLAAVAAIEDGDLTPVSPASFLPGGMLGVQIGSSWDDLRKGGSLGKLACQPRVGNDVAFDEVCFFKTSSQVAGAAIHDGFIVRKGDRVVLIGTGIAIKNADDPLAESVVRDLMTQVHSKYQQTGSDLLFVNLPERHMSAGELVGFSETAPVLLVEMEPKGDELALFYGYLAPVNAFSVMAGE
jgi:hypothetical protein